MKKLSFVVLAIVMLAAVPANAEDPAMKTWTGAVLGTATANRAAAGPYGAAYQNKQMTPAMGVCNNFLNGKQVDVIIDPSCPAEAEDDWLAIGPVGSNLIRGVAGPGEITLKVVKTEVRGANSERHISEQESQTGYDTNGKHYQWNENENHRSLSDQAREESEVFTVTQVRLVYIDKKCNRDGSYRESVIASCTLSGSNVAELSGRSVERTDDSVRRRSDNRCGGYGSNNTIRTRQLDEFVRNPQLLAAKQSVRLGGSQFSVALSHVLDGWRQKIEQARYLAIKAQETKYPTPSAPSGTPDQESEQQTQVTLTRIK